MVRKLLFPLMVLGLMSLAPSMLGVASAGGGPRPDCEVSDDTPQAGQQINVLGSGWFPDTRVSIKFAQQGSHVTPLDSARAEGDSTFTQPVMIPGGASLGPASIICKGRNLETTKGGDRVPITIVP